MRWSTPCFGLGLALGLVAALGLWLTRSAGPTSSFEPGRRGTRAEPAAHAASQGDTDTESDTAPDSGDPAVRSSADGGDPPSGSVEAGSPTTRRRRPRHEGDREAESSSDMEISSSDSEEDTDSAPRFISDQELVFRPWRHGKSHGRLQIELVSSGSQLRTILLGGSALTDSVRLDWERAWEAAGDWGVDTKTPDPDHVDALLASRDGGDVLLGIGLAARNAPPLMDPLIRVVQDRSAGSFRAVALVALAHHHGGGDAGTAAFVEAAHDEAFHVRETALQLYPHVGAGASAAAMELLRTGSVGDEYQEPLARTVAAGDVGDTLAFLGSRLDTEAALPTTIALLRRADLEPHEWTAIHAAVPRVIQAHLRSPAFSRWSAQLAEAVARTGDVTVLRDLATSPLLTVELRLQAVEAAFAQEATIESAPDLQVAVLTDPASPPRLIRRMLSRLGPEDATSPRYADLLWDLAHHHRDRWVREDARIRLQSTDPADAAGLRIVSATYGKDGKTVDVRDVLAAKIADGRLVVHATNELAGDPSVGITKELVVTYTLDGKRHTRTASEGGVLSIP